MSEQYLANRIYCEIKILHDFGLGAARLNKGEFQMVIQSIRV